MSPLFNKLNLKDQNEILVVNAPASFDTELALLDAVTIRRDVAKSRQCQFALVFAVKQTEVDKYSEALAGKLEGDAILWFAYPKGSSKKYQCDFNRDTGWDVLRSLGFDTVRMVAIDADWSALRFRRVEFIRNRA